MDKKNTMLLTVIAVATLLVAVVGATFAFFSLNVTGSTNTTATVTTEKAGLFTFDKGKTALGLKIGADLMSKSLVNAENTQSVDYYANINGTETPKTVTPGKAAADEESYTSIGKLTLKNADNGVKYHCQAKYTITTSFEDADDIEGGDAEKVKGQVQTQDGMLYLKTTTKDSKITMAIKNDKDGQPDSAGESETLTHDLQSLVAGAKTFWVTYDFTSDGSTIDADLQAALKVSNRNADQNYLAGKKITLTIVSDKVDCNFAGKEA